MVKIYFVEPYSAWLKNNEMEFLKFGIEITNDVYKADVLISARLAPLVNTDKKLKKRKLLWTNEPRWSDAVESDIFLEDESISVMNCYTGDIYHDIFFYLWVTSMKPCRHLVLDDVKKKEKNNLSYFMASNHGNGKPFVVNGLNIDLYNYRDSLALFGKKQGLVDLYGEGWPSGLATSGTRQGKNWRSWESEKEEVAKNYLFSIAIENTDVRNYISEKLWHSIMFHTVPILYKGQSGIEKYFGNTGVVYSNDFSEFAELFDFLSSMRQSEYLDRINGMIDVFNNIVSQKSNLEDSQNKTIKSFVYRVLNIVS